MGVLLNKKSLCLDISTYLSDLGFRKDGFLFSIVEYNNIENLIQEYYHQFISNKLILNQNHHLPPLVCLPNVLLALNAEAWKSI